MRSPRASAPLLAALAILVSAWPAAGQSPSVAPSPAPTPVDAAARPMPAPAGWLLTVVQDQTAGGDSVQVLATAPDGGQRVVATIDDVSRSVDGEPPVADVEEVLPVTVDGMLPVILEWTDEQGAGHRLLHVHDLFGSDPPAPVLSLGGDAAQDMGSVASGPDGRIAVDVPDRAVDGTATARHTLLLDPLTGRTMQLREARGDLDRSDLWLATGAGWPAWRDQARGVLTTAGTFRPTSAPFPLVDLARGGAQEAVSGQDVGTWDSASSGKRGTGGPPCREWWTVPPEGEPITEIWWDRCKDQGTVRDLRMDVDGEGILALVDRKAGLQLIRRDQPRTETVLATIKGPALAKARDRSRQIEVLGLAPGPRPDELLLAFSPVDHYGSIFFLSTVEGAVHEVPGTFAGFVEPPIDRDVAGLTPFALAAPAVPATMLAPTDALLAWIAGPTAADGSRALRIVAIDPDGTVHEVTRLQDVLDTAHQLVEDALPAMRITPDGHLPIPFGPDADATQPAEVRLIDLHDPTAAPLVLTDAPDRIHDWTTLRSAPSGRLSVHLTDGPLDDQEAIQELDPTDGSEYLVPFSPDLTVDPDPVRTSDGWPAWDATDAGVLERANAQFITPPRLVALARGAEQVATNGSRLWRVVPTNPRAPGCDTGVLRSGRTDGTGPVWWNPCRQPGGVLDIRWDVDGQGALVLVRRGDIVRLLRERRPGRFERVGSFPISAIGGPDAVRGLAVDALMAGRAPGELLLALHAGGHPWRWSSLTNAPVPLTLAEGESAGFAGFSVEPGDTR